ncbi:coiled-coil domain-containing protein 201-like isoform X1 [Meleagris gallopavo]|uniref:coiled-coil domain-containing protein 201-like isoform X1 n=1 Tax=Meleagris gallopavo TaxID=9103 RepID=UPI000549B9F9|nr:coiled-coil domain-containing protein 201-like isoform X1 [Meleagris gallopavo]
MELNSTGSKPDFQMSEEEASIPDVKRSEKRKLVKHSTPVDSVFSRNTLSLSGPINWSVKDQDFSKRAYVSPVPKSTLGRSVAQLSLASVEAYFPHTSPKRFSAVFDLQDSSREISHSSQAVYSRKRLSTVLASDESNEEASENVVSSVETQTPTKASEKLAVIPKSGSSWMVSGIPGIKDPPMLKKKKTDKAIVRKKQREWVLRQLKNIEEATKHELTIEEV